MRKLKIISPTLIFLLFTVVIFLFSGCIAQKRIVYLQNLAGKDTTTVYTFVPGKEYKVITGDNLFIKVLGLDERANMLFNATSGSTGYMSTTGEASVYLTSYTVNSSGNIDLPVVGTLKVAGKTLDEIKSDISKAVSAYLKDCTVIVKLVSFNVTLLGEVHRPGAYPVYQETLTIFEALGLAGDITVFGNRNKIHLLRQTEKGAVLKDIDLTSKDILKSEYYYLKPNDIIYVEPLKGKVWAFEAFPYTLFLTTITTTLVIWNFFK